MNRSIRNTRWLPLGVLLMMTACLPIPNVRVDLELPAAAYLIEPERVRAEMVSLPGYPEPNTPENLNRALYLRLYSTLEPTHTVLILMPGLFGGAGSLELLGRQLVATVPGLEIWAVDRRANLLEDRSAVLQSLDANDPMIAYDYYVTNAGQVGGFIPLEPDDVRFMAYWGLRVHLYDLHSVVQEAQAAAETVVLGGHSLGASLAPLYAAHLFEEGAGYTFIDGLVLLDGTVGRTGGFDNFNEGLTLGAFRVTPSIAELEAGIGSPFLSFLEANPLSFGRSEVSALLAQADPDGLSPAGFLPYPATNRAAFALSGSLTSDDEYSYSTAFSISMGRTVGARYAGNIIPVILGGLEGIYSRSVEGVAEGFDYVDWGRGDPQRERTDIDALARVMTSRLTNFPEWYFPLRLLLEMAQLDTGLREASGFIPHAEVPLPTLAVGAGRGLVATLEGFSTYINLRAGSAFSPHILPGFTHIDIVTAETNPLVPLFARWLGGVRP